MDALWFGCVPVLLADHYVPPLPSLVNWDELAITVPEREVGLVDLPQTKVHIAGGSVELKQQHQHTKHLNV